MWDLRDRALSGNHIPDVCRIKASPQRMPVTGWAFPVPAQGMKLHHPGHALPQSRTSP